MLKEWKVYKRCKGAVNKTITVATPKLASIANTQYSNGKITRKRRRPQIWTNWLTSETRTCKARYESVLNFVALREVSATLLLSVLVGAVVLDGVGPGATIWWAVTRPTQRAHQAKSGTCQSGCSVNTPISPAHITDWLLVRHKINLIFSHQIVAVKLFRSHQAFKPLIAASLSSAS